MIDSKLNFRAACKTTAMGIMPHTDIESALNLALSLDIPFCPQLPNVSFYEDMYVQTSQNFPGIAIDPQNEKISFDSARFETELTDYSQRMADPGTFALGKRHSVVYHRFLAANLRDYTAVRSQVTGPVSFGFRVTDENSKPIIYDEGIGALLFDFIQRKANHQYRQLSEKNPNAFVWLDEPGLGWVFSGLTGYDDIRAKRDYRSFLDGLEGPRALHLCANVNLPYLLEMGAALLSFDAYQMKLMPKGYARSVADFINAGGVISWGIVPIDSESIARETPRTLADLLAGYWEVVSREAGVPGRQIAEQALLAPARCCLKNIGRVGAAGETDACPDGEKVSRTAEEVVVEKAFGYLKSLSEIIKARFHL
ncbi:MAG: hypothetical protein HYX83_03575 [Chloroflexi bacterium]|nr:hypothetical protein [Chloroflexota bacterium]